MPADLKAAAKGLTSEPKVDPIKLEKEEKISEKQLEGDLDEEKVKAGPPVRSANAAPKAVLRLGDMQAHRYTYAPAMEPNALTPEEQAGMAKIDDAHQIVFDNWNVD